MPYGLKDIELQKLCKVFESNERIERVVLYGSRAKGNYKPFSDVDITLIGEELTHTDLNRISLAIDDLLLPYQFDISIFHTLKNEALIDHIHRVGITIYERESEWKEYKLGEIATRITSGGTPKSSEASYYDGDIPWLNTKEINFNRITKTERCITQEGLNNSSAKWIPKGAVIVAMYGATAAKVAYSLIDLTTNQACCNLIIKESMADGRFVYYYIQSSYEELLNLACGAAQQNLSVGVIADFPISLPSLDEQHRIASILTSLDDKIDLLRRENATLEAIAETLFRQWFVVEAKEEWEEGKLGDYVDVVDNRGKTPPFINAVTEYPIIEVNALTGNERHINYDAVRKYVTKEVKDSWFRGHFQKNDILVSTVGSIGELAMCLEEKGVIAQNVIALHASKISPFYLYQYLLLNKDDLKGLDIGSVQPSIKVPHLLRMPIVLPPINLLNKYDTIMVEVIEKEKNNNKQIQTLIQTRDGLLPRLMSNEINIRR